MRLIDADKLKEKLKAHHDFFVNAWGGFSNLPVKDKARVDEITNCIAEVVNAPTIDPESLRPQESKPLEAFLHPIDAYKGLKAKYLVFKADTGERVDNCFILRPDKDPAAVAALRAYAAATDNGVLTEDIYNWVGKGESLRPQGEWVWKHRHHGGFRRYTGVDDFGNTHTITVDERFECDEPYCPNCGKWNESVFLNYCPDCGANMKGGTP